MLLWENSWCPFSFFLLYRLLIKELNVTFFIFKHEYLLIISTFLKNKLHHEFKLDIFFNWYLHNNPLPLVISGSKASANMDGGSIHYCLVFLFTFYKFIFFLWKTCAATSLHQLLHLHQIKRDLLKRKVQSCLLASEALFGFS